MAGEYIEFNNNSQPALNDTNINRLQQLIKQDIQGAVSGDTLPVGAIMPFGSDTIPENWLLCNGQAVSRTDYQELFNTIGTNFGSGDGFTTFNLPDLRKRVPVGKDENDEDFDTLGNTGGEKEHTLTIDEIPSHNHKTNIGVALSPESSGYRIGESGVVRANDNIERDSQNTGGNQPHSILQPYIVQNYIIKAKQSAGVVATVVDGLNSTSATNALSANQGKILKELMEGTILYENEQGTNSNFVLSDNSSNYSRLKVFGFFRSSNFSRKFTQELEISSGTDVNNLEISVIENTSLNATLVGTARVIFNGNQATITNNYTRVINGSDTATDEIHVTKVVGYKY